MTVFRAGGANTHVTSPAEPAVRGNKLHEGEASLAAQGEAQPVAVWELLDQLGITQKELARRSGISAGYLSQLIRGARSPSVRTQRWLQQALGVTDWDRLFFMEPASE